MKNLLRIAAVAYAQGHTSWISANRVVGRRIDSHRSATSLAILIELRLIEAAAHWQHRHVTTNACGDFVDKLISELHETGLLEWDSEVGREVAALVVRSGQKPHHSWASEPELLPLRAAFQTPGSTLTNRFEKDFSDALGAGGRLGETVVNSDLDRFLDEP